MTCFTANEKNLVVAFSDNMIRIWEIEHHESVIAVIVILEGKVVPEFHVFDHDIPYALLVELLLTVNDVGNVENV